MYNDVLADIEGAMAAVADLTLFPSNFAVQTDCNPQYGILKVMPTNGTVVAHAVTKELSGLVAVKLFVPSGQGESKLFELADQLDTALQYKYLNNRTRLGASYLSIEGPDPENSSLYSGSYFIPFTIYKES